LEYEERIMVFPATLSYDDDDDDDDDDITTELSSTMCFFGSL
jgi:hypothetical protein